MKDFIRVYAVRATRDVGQSLLPLMVRLSVPLMTIRLLLPFVILSRIRLKLVYLTRSF